MAGQSVAEFVAAQRVKRADRGLDTRIADHAVYQLLDGLLAARGGGRRG